METVASWHGEVNYKRYQSLGVVGRLVELGSHDSQLPPRADPRARATVLFLRLLPLFHPPFLTLSPLSFSPSPSSFHSRSPSFSPLSFFHTSPFLLFLRSKLSLPFSPSLSSLHPLHTNTATHTAAVTDVDARASAPTRTHLHVLSPASIGN